jgi:hypothetical protein
MKKKKHPFLHPHPKCTSLAFKTSLLSLLALASLALLFSPINYYALRLTFKAR